LNIVGNAIKFTRQGGVRVAVRFVAGTSRLEFEIVDTGIGMSEEQLGRLFQPFEQADLSMTRRYGGSGLGLAISKGLVEALGGEIAATSTPGQGSRFTIGLPIVAAAGSPMVHGLSEARRATAGAPSPAAKLSGTVLLAEDGPDNQILITTLLRKYGLTVGVVGNGALAYERALGAARAGTPYDLVLMDMQMPVMDGYDATRRLRSAGYKGPVVALTAHAMEGERDRCVAAGCDDYVRKPIDRSELHAALQRYLGGGAPPAAARDPGDAPAEAEIVSAFADDPDMQEIVERFVASLPDRLAALRADVAAGTRPSLQRLAHQLKGAAGGYGFPAITGAAAALEKAIVDEADDARVHQAVDELAGLCARARARAS
jgi:CheY-like chemotaxis protein/HPt (histidine-containing phosphotransfer) domain-containing protein